MSKIKVPSLFQEELAHGNTAKAIKGADTEQLANKVVMMSLKDIHIVPGLNPRVSNTAAMKAHIEGIGKSIIANGFYADKPLAVFATKIDGKDVTALRDGHNRYAGAEWANKKQPGTVDKVPVIFDAEEMSKLDMIVSFHTANTGKPLGPYEQAILVIRAFEEGATKKEIAARLGCTERYIDDLGLLVKAPEEVIDMVLNDRVSATLAIEMVKTHGDKAGKKLEAAAKKLDAIGHPGRVTSKHLPAEDRPKTKKSAGAKTKDTTVATATPEPEKEPGTVFVRDIRLDAALACLKILNSQANDLTESERTVIDASMLAIVEEFGDSAVIEYALADEVSDYEDTGLVRLGLVTLEGNGEEGGEGTGTEGAEPPAAEAPEPEKAPEPPAAKKGGSKKKKVSEEALAGL